MTYENQWFHGRHSIRQLPQECVCDCAAPGRPADEYVARWVDRLQFDGPAWLFRQYLSGFGAWSAAELCDHNENRKRVLWIWACSVRETPGERDYLYLGI